MFPLALRGSRDAERRSEVGSAKIDRQPSETTHATPNNISFKGGSSTVDKLLRNPPSAYGGRRQKVDLGTRFTPAIIPRMLRHPRMRYAELPLDRIVTCSNRIVDGPIC
jgi:hypothetical protein